MRFKRIIAVPDIHGCYYILKNLIEQEIVFDPSKDKLVFLGDYIDFRKVNDNVSGLGVNSAKVVEYVSSLKQSWPDNIILLKGNHESLAEKALKTSDPMDLKMWTINGGSETIFSFGGMGRARDGLLPFISTLALYHEIPEATFVHGGLPFDKTPAEATEKELLWHRGGYEGEKFLVVGHCITDEIRMCGNKLNLDLGCFTTGRLAGYDILSGRIYEAGKSRNLG